MNNLKTGDIISNDNKRKRVVLGQCGPVFFVSDSWINEDNNKASKRYSGTYTLDTLISSGYKIWEEKKEEVVSKYYVPKENEQYYYISLSDEVSSTNWNNDEFDLYKLKIYIFKL
jgi:hypothetical protein